MKKIFITGGTGRIGNDVSDLLKDKYKVYAGTTQKDFKIKDYDVVFSDITDRESLMRLMKKINPDYVLHLAALTDVNLCEENKELAAKVNIEGTKNVVLASNKVSAKLVHASTNYIFDGEKGMYKEEDEPKPVNFYSLTKLLAEKEILKYPNSVITRVCPFGWGYRNKLTFMRWIVNKLSNQEKINLFTDQFFSPISTYDYAEVLAKIFENNFTGVLNIAGSERLSRYDFAKKVADVFELNSGLLNPIKISDMKENAKRPRDTSLDISQAKNLFGDIFPDAESGIRKMKELKDSERL